MSKTKKPRKRTDVDRALERVKSLCGEIVYWIESYHGRSGTSFEKLLQWRQERIFDNPNYNKLQQWAKERISHCFDNALKTVSNRLIWTHVVDGERMLYTDPRLHDRAREVNEQMQALKDQGKANSAYCYAFCDTENNNRLILIPYREEDQQKEIESGRLSADDLNRPYHHKVVFLRSAHQPNGRNALAVTVAVEVNGNQVSLPENILKE